MTYWDPRVAAVMAVLAAFAVWRAMTWASRLDAEAEEEELDMTDGG